MAKILLVDGNSLTYRAFFALPPDMATASGQVTNAVFGFTSMLINVLKDHRPDGMLVAFDRPEPTFRHVADPEYKANRDAAPDILRQQMGLVREVLDSLGIKQVELAGWEADDLIAAATAGLVERGDDVVIVTGDRDSYQLVSDPHVKVLYNRRGVSDYAMYDEAGILEKTGVTPALYPQYAALRGDTSDNLPGVPGVGEKTAAKLINTYGGLDGIFANVEQQTPKLRASLTEHEERVRKNLEMMVLSADAPLDGVDLGDLAIVPKPDEVKRLFEFLEFRTFADRLAEALGDSKVALAVGAERQELHAEVTVVESAAEAVELIGSLAVLDVMPAWIGEPGRSALAGLAIVTDAAVAEVAWIPGELVADDSVAAIVAAHGNVRSHNAKQLMRSLLDLGHDLTGLQLDTTIVAYLIDPAEAGYALADLVEKFTAFAAPARGGAAAGQLDLDGSTLDVSQLAAREALAVHHVAGPLNAALEAQGMTGLYRDIENSLVRVLARMEHVGIAVDRDMLRSINVRLIEEVERLGAELRRVVGRDDLNFNSPVQLRELLFTAARTLRREEDQDRVLDRRRDAREAPRPMARVHRSAAAPPRGREAARHLRRRACSTRSPPTVASTPRSTRRWPGRDVSAPIVPTCTTSRSAARKAGCSAPRSCRVPATSSSSPTTTRSSSAASPTWRPTRA